MPRTLMKDERFTGPVITADPKAGYGWHSWADAVEELMVDCPPPPGLYGDESTALVYPGLPTYVFGVQSALNRALVK